MTRCTKIGRKECLHRNLIIFALMVDPVLIKCGYWDLAADKKEFAKISRISPSVGKKSKNRSPKYQKLGANPVGGP